jgi:hypothetical protein
LARTQAPALWPTLALSSRWFFVADRALKNVVRDPMACDGGRRICISATVARAARHHERELALTSVSQADQRRSTTEKNV